MYCLAAVTHWVVNAKETTLINFSSCPHTKQRFSWVVGKLQEKKWVLCKVFDLSKTGFFACSRRVRCRNVHPINPVLPPSRSVAATLSAPRSSSLAFLRRSNRFNPSLTYSTIAINLWNFFCWESQGCIGEGMMVPASPPYNTDGTIFPNSSRNNDMRHILWYTETALRT